MIYLDAAAGEPLLDRCRPFLQTPYLNASTLYKVGKRSAQEIENCRAQIAGAIGALPSEIVFTSGGSESNALAWNGRRCGITTPIEHKSILMNSTAKLLVNVNPDGTVDKSHFRKICKLGQADFVSIQSVNNETGQTQVIQSLAKIAHANGLLFHSDGVQAFGKEKIQVHELGVDYMSFSGHKIGAPQGIGFLYVRSGCKVKPLIPGTQENGRRGGTQSPALIAALAKAAQCSNGINEKIKRSKHNTERFAAKLQNEFGCKINGFRSGSLIVSATFPQSITAEALMYMLDAGYPSIMVGLGSACSRGEPSHVLAAMGLTESEISRTVRFSIPMYAGLPVEQEKIVISAIRKAIEVIQNATVQGI